MSLYDLTVKDTKGNDVKLDEFRGKVLLIEEYRLSRLLLMLLRVPRSFI